MDAILSKMGEFGTYQKRKFSLLAMQFCMSGVYLYSVLYILGEPPHRCKVDANDTYSIRDAQHNSSVIQNIPLDEKGLFKPCTMYKDGAHGSEIFCNDLVFDTSEVGVTLASEFSLVCEKRQLAATVTTMAFVGRLIGSLVIGVLADRYGRKSTYVVFIIALTVSCAASIAPNPYSYLVFRLFGGLFNVGAYDCAYVIIMEIVGPTKRTLITTLASLIYTIGYLLIDAMAYFLRDWQYLSIFVTAPFVIYVFVVIWLIPESPRWLITMGRITEARKVIDTASTANGVAFPDQEFDKVVQHKEGEAKGHDIKVLFKNRTMLKRVILFIILWFSVDMGYYGVSLQSGYLFGGLYLNNALVAVSEIPSLLLTYTSSFIGRKKSTVISTLMATSGLLCSGLLQFFSHSSDTGYGILASTMFGKVGSASAYILLYVWTVEAVPTGYRNLVLGICSAASGLSTTIAPFIVQINTDKGSASQALPSIIFGALIGFATLAALPLPETNKENLPDDINGAVKLGEKKEDDVTLANTCSELTIKEDQST